MDKLDIKSMTKSELESIVSPKFRATQIFKWLFQQNVKSFEEMKNLPKSLREELGSKYFINSLEILQVQKSKDGSKKYLFRLIDGYSVEAVLLPMKRQIVDNDGKIIKEAKWTICISSQVGCKIGCSFCLTAKEGFKRDLSASEIVSQVQEIKDDNNIPLNKRVNLVYMGMGEPLDNLDNVAKAVEIFKDNDGLSIGARRQTISTSGLSNQIKKLGETTTQVIEKSNKNLFNKANSKHFSDEMNKNQDEQEI